ncbi:hypothetical protein CV023_16055 [Brevibacterium sp. CCUG 69071]|nr:hypothetical protein [Brevibacterium sp. CCUG 69071]
MDSVHDALTISEHPPSPKGDTGGSTGASKPPMPVSILDAKLDLKQKLVSWALMIGEEREVVIDCDDNSYSLAGWIYTQAEWLAEHAALDDFTTEIQECVKALRRPYASKDERRLVTIFAGAPIYAWPWETTVRLPDGTVHLAHTLREELKGQTMDRTLAAPNVSAVLREIFNMDVPADTIRKTAKRGKLTKYPEGFNVGEVVERFATRALTLVS